MNIEICDERGGFESQAGAIEATKIFSDISCVREIVRFVHEHNACICLESAYNELKKLCDERTCVIIAKKTSLSNKSKRAQDAKSNCIVLESVS